MSKPKYEIVLIDADETIFDFKKAERVAFKKTINHFGYDCIDDDVRVYSEINLKYWKQLEKGLIDREELKVKRFEEWFEYMGLDLDSISFNDFYAPALGEFGFLIDGAEAFLKKLSGFCDIYIITNGLVTTQNNRFNQSSVKSYIKKLYISEAIGYSKPSREFFDFCIDDIGEPDRTKYIVLGDSLTSDMQGGRNSNLATCLFSRDNIAVINSLCDYVISDYNEFFRILEV